MNKEKTMPAKKAARSTKQQAADRQAAGAVNSAAISIVQRVKVHSEQHSEHVQPVGIQMVL
eukprot:scaffold131663_cov23-Tisochrysis_lutea.AAC.2